MNMVWHDAPSVKTIARIIEMDEGAFHQRSRMGVAQQPFAISGVEQGFETLTTQSWIAVGRHL